MNINQILKTRADGENLADKLSEEELSKIGWEGYDQYKTDLESRNEWEVRYKEANKLALQVPERKNTPWEGASNVKFPLLTVACIQFQSRVYGQLVAGTNIVKMRVIGEDPTMEKLRRARRVETHMSYQILEEDESWEEEMDRLLMALPLVGTVFKKTFYDPEKSRLSSRLVLPKDLVVNYFAKSLESASCVTHVIEKYPNEMETYFRMGIYRRVELTMAQHDGADHIQKGVDNRVGITRPKSQMTDPYKLLELHWFLDLDEDGYKEPYIVTILKDTYEVLRIVPRFRQSDVEMKGNEVLRIIGRQHFKKYSLIPSPDGSFYDLGFGSLLGPLNDSVNTLINQLIDAGTLANRQGGFLGRAARLKGGRLKFKIGEWQNVNVNGDDLRKAIVPLPVRDPSSVLFQVLGFLVDYGERLSSVSEMMVGKTPGQNTPATTSMAALEEGMKVYTSIYKRIYRSLRDEFRLRYELNREYLDPEEYYVILDEGREGKIFQQDYLGDSTDIRPAADPTIVSDMQRLQRAQALAERAQMVQGYNTSALELRILEAMHVPGVQEIFPVDEQGQALIQPPPDPKTEIESAKFQFDSGIKSRELRGKLALIDAQIIKLEADSILAMAKAEAAEEGIQLDQYKQRLDTMKEQRETVKAMMDQQNAEREQQQQQQQPTQPGQ
jgi:chaperonin GroES